MPTNSSAVSKCGGDPLRAPVCRKGKLIGEVSTNWKALCQQQKLESKDESGDVPKATLTSLSGQDRSTRIIEFGGEKAAEDERKLTSQKKREKRKRKRVVEAENTPVESDAKVGADPSQNGGSCVDVAATEEDEKVMKRAKKKRKIETASAAEHGEDAVERVRPPVVDVTKVETSAKKERKKKIKNENSLATEDLQKGDTGDSTKQDVKVKSKDSTNPKSNSEQRTVIVPKRSKTIKTSSDTGNEVAQTVKALITSTKEGCGEMRTSTAELKGVVNKALATETVSDVEKQFKVFDANVKLLHDSGNVFSKKRDASPIEMKSDASAIGSVAKKPADFWFDDVDLSDVARTKKPTTALLISGQDTSVGKYVALDCEMVGTGPEGCRSMLARCSIVNHHGNVIYDSFVAPMDTITDYRTRYSGVREEHLKDAPSFKTVQKKVSDLLKGKILVGHGLKHDLRALLLSHPKKDTRDTISYKPFRALSQGKIPSLRKLAKELLGVDIQDNEHSSIEDAQAAMRLYQKHKAEWETRLKKRERFNGGEAAGFRFGAQKPAKARQPSVARTKTSEKYEPFNVMLQCD